MKAREKFCQHIKGKQRSEEISDIDEDHKRRDRNILRGKQ